MKNDIKYLSHSNIKYEIINDIDNIFKKNGYKVGEFLNNIRSEHPNTGQNTIDYDNVVHFILKKDHEKFKDDRQKYFALRDEDFEKCLKRFNPIEIYVAEREEDFEDFINRPFLKKDVEIIEYKITLNDSDNFCAYFLFKRVQQDLSTKCDQIAQFDY